MAIKFGAGKTTAKPAAGKPAAVKKGSSGAGQGASLIPTDWTSGGLLNDVNVTIVDMTFVDDWTYGGTVSDPVLALAVTFHKDDQIEGEEDTVQHFSAGDLARWVPDPDNPKHVIPAENSSAKALNNNTNCAAFLGSLIEAGFPVNAKGHEVTEFVDVFEGTYCHVMRVPQKKRTGLVAADDKQRDVLIVDQVLRLPWEKAGAKTTAKPAGPQKAAAGKPNGKPAAAPVDETAEEGEGPSEELVMEAAELVSGILSEKNGKIASSALTIAALKPLQGNDNRAAIIALLKDPDFLGMEGAPWSFDGKTLTAEA
jgi:hypothetical protein